MLADLEAHASVSSLEGTRLRSVLAFAEAIIPGSAHTPGADEATVARLEQVADQIHPRSKDWLTRALWVLDQAARLRTGKPFHALSRRAQDETLAAWEKTPSLRSALIPLSYALKIIHFDHPRTFEALGGKLQVIADPPAARWEQQITHAADWTGDTDIECDVVVVGTGAGGAVVGSELALRGHAVVFVEEGRRLKGKDFKGSFVHAHSSYYRNTLTMGNSPITLLMGKLVGGSTAVNGGTSLKPPSWVLDEWSEQLACDDFAPKSFEPHMERVLQKLEVSAAERRFIGPLADVTDRGAAKLGWHVGPIPRNAVGCEGQGFCDFGCSSGARRGVDVAFLPAALERGGIVLAELKAEHVITEGGRAVGVEGVDRSGRRFRIRAKAVVLSLGTVNTPLLLQKQGLGGSSGELGKNLSLHPSTGVSAVYDDLLEPHRYIPQGYMVDHFLRDGWLALAAQPDLNIAHMMFPTTGSRLMEALDEVPHMGGWGVLIRDESRGRVWFDVMGQPAMTYNMNHADVKRMQKAMSLMGELSFASGARRVRLGVFGQGPIDSPAELARFASRKLEASDLALISYHPLGTCKIGRDPRTSVVDLDHQLHDTKGLFVVDGSTVPGPPGVNPQITIMAMAMRAAERIHGHL